MRTRQDAAGDGNAVLIDQRYLVLPDRPCGDFAGLPAFVVEHGPADGDAGGRGARRGQPPLLAMRTRRDAPPPANLPSFLGAYNTALLMPVAHGPGAGEYWIVCDAPGGPSLQASAPDSPTPLSETDLTTSFLRPLSVALGRLHALGLVHRAVRPSNLFRSAESGRILLGPGCVLPPAFAQPVLYEPPAVGLCLPACRGPGLPADDIYALGVVLLELALGRAPMQGLDDEQIVRRKLELGSFQAMTMNERLPPILLSLLRAMLSDEPQGRPSLEDLAENGIGAERPKASRPEGRAPRPLMVGRVAVFTGRMLAQAIARQPGEALALLRSGALDQWLRRALEQPVTASRIDEALRSGRDRSTAANEDMVLMQIIALLDPTVPMFWRGRWLWPDAVPAMLAAQMTMPDERDIAGDALRHGALRRWAMLTGRSGLTSSDHIERCSARAGRLPTPALRQPMLTYSLNPFLACVSPVLGNSCVLQPEQLLDALETMAPAQGNASVRLLDTQMLAMLAARSEQPPDMPQITVPADIDERLLDLQALAQAQLLARSRQPGEAPNSAALPKLAALLLPPARERVQGWPGKGRAERRLARLEQAAAVGDLVAMLDLSCRDDAWAADAAALAEARAQAAALREQHQASTAAAPDRARATRTAGREVAVVGGIVALVGAVAVGFLC